MERLDAIANEIHDVRVLIEGVRAAVGNIVQLAEDHEQRLRVLEKWRNNLTPLIALGTFIGGAFFQVFVARLG